MASSVDTTVTYAHSQMSGAPVLTAQAGSLIALLDAVLVTGFDSKSATSITIANGLATLTFSAPHSAIPESVIEISGATAPFTDINGRQKVIAKTPTTITFKTMVVDGTVTGTLTFMMSSANWSKVFTGTNLAVYKSVDLMSNGHFLRIDDSDPVVARIRGYENMSDVNTGTTPFPADSQMSIGSMSTPNVNGTIGGYWFKGFSANTNPVGWTFVGDQRFFMYCSQNQQNQGVFPDSVFGQFRGFGDPIAFKPSGDPYGTLLSVGYLQSQTQNQSGSFSQGDNSYGAVYAARPYTGVGIPQQLAVCSYNYTQTNNEPLSGAVPNSLGKFPSIVDGSLRFSQKFVRIANVDSDADNSPRANIPGILSIPMYNVFNGLPPKTVIPGSGLFAGRKLVSVAIGPYGSNPINNPGACGICLVDITGPWR